MDTAQSKGDRASRNQAFVPTLRTRTSSRILPITVCMLCRPCFFKKPTLALTLLKPLAGSPRWGKWRKQKVEIRARAEEESCGRHDGSGRATGRIAPKCRTFRPHF